MNPVVMSPRRFWTISRSFSGEVIAATRASASRVSHSSGAPPAEQRTLTQPRLKPRHWREEARAPLRARRALAGGHREARARKLSAAATAGPAGLPRVCFEAWGCRRGLILLLRASACATTLILS